MMKYSEGLVQYSFRPQSGEVRQDRVVVTALGLASTQANTTPRLQMLSDLLQTEIIGVQRRGTSTTEFDPYLREQLASPEEFVEQCGLDADKLNEQIPRLADYPARLLEGSSGGGALALGVVCARPDFATNLLLREAYNHKAMLGKPEREGMYALRVIHDMLPNIPLLDRHRPPKSNPQDVPQAPDFRTAREKFRDFRQSMQTKYTEMCHYGPNACSTFAAEHALKIAAVKELSHVAMLSVEYTHGLGGDPALAHKLSEKLKRYRGVEGAELRAVVVDGLRHSALLDPYRHRDDIEATFALHQATTS